MQIKPKKNTSKTDTISREQDEIDCSSLPRRFFKQERQLQHYIVILILLAQLIQHSKTFINIRIIKWFHRTYRKCDMNAIVSLTVTNYGQR